MIAPQISDAKFEKEMRDLAKKERRSIAGIFRIMARYGVYMMEKQGIAFTDAMDIVEPGRPNRNNRSV